MADKFKELNDAFDVTPTEIEVEESAIERKT